MRKKYYLCTLICAYMKLLLVLLAVMTWTVESKNAVSLSDDSTVPYDIEVGYGCTYQKGDVRANDTATLVLSHLEGITINGIPDGADKIRLTAPHIISASVEGIRAEVLLHALEDKGVYVSSGSACASNKPAISATLKAIGVDNKLLDSTIRISMSHFTTKDEIVYACDSIEELIPQLRKYVRK